MKIFDEQRRSLRFSPPRRSRPPRCSAWYPGSMERWRSRLWCLTSPLHGPTAITTSADDQYPSNICKGMGLKTLAAWGIWVILASCHSSRYLIWSGPREFTPHLSKLNHVKPVDASSYELPVSLSTPSKTPCNIQFYPCKIPTQKRSVSCWIPPSITPSACHHIMF